MHVIYKREVLNENFCGIINEFSSSELEENEVGIIQNEIFVGQVLLKKSNLVVCSYFLLKT